ncbi:MAG: ABC transporter ATP-binding protein, partial [Lachnospiraceae bacterium]
QYDTPENIFYKPCNRKVADYFGKVNYISGIVENEIFKNEICNLDASGYLDGTYEALIRPFSIALQTKGNDFVIEEVTFLGETAEIILSRKKKEYTACMLSHEFSKTGLIKGMTTGVQIASEYIQLVKENEV